MRVLVVDDDKISRDFLKHHLVALGHEVVQALDGDDALEQIRKDPVDLVITDILMPGKEGIETIRELKRDFPQTKIIAVSGGGKIEAQDYLKMAEGLGVERTLMKPVEPEDLFRAIEEIF